METAGVFPVELAAKAAQSNVKAWPSGCDRKVVPAIIGAKAPNAGGKGNSLDKIFANANFLRCRLIFA